VGFLVAVRLTGLCRSVAGTSWLVVLRGLPLFGIQAKAGQGLRDGVDIDERGKKDQIIVHSCAEKIQVPKPDMGAQSEANAMIDRSLTKRIVTCKKPPTWRANYRCLENRGSR
jgi:hypothetical protein